MIIIYTDGACSGNPGVGGWGAVILEENNDPIYLKGGEKNTTNNRMELMAAIQGLKYYNNEKNQQKNVAKEGPKKQKSDDFGDGHK